jgi:hypothetical protein
MSPRTLLRRFKEATGLAPNEWLVRERVAAAREMLESGRVALGRVAERAGFGSQESFRRHFSPAGRCRARCVPQAISSEPDTIAAMSSTLTTTPAADGFRMPGEFERHSGCWLLWPERPSNWRCGAKPAQEAFAAVATAIATGEPVTVGASRAQFVNARAMLPDAIRVVEMSSDDSVDARRRSDVRRQRRGRGARRRLDVQCLGGLVDGLYFPWDQDDLVARKVLELEGAIGIARRSCWKAARFTSTARARCSRPRNACSIRIAIRSWTRAS